MRSSGHGELFRQMRAAAVQARSERDDGARAEAIALLLDIIEELERRGLMDALEPWLAPRQSRKPGTNAPGLDRPPPPDRM